VEETINGFDGTITGTMWNSGRNGIVFNGIDNSTSLPQKAIDTVDKLEVGTISILFNFEDNLDQQPIQPLLYLGIDDENEMNDLFIIEIGHNRSFNRKLYVTWMRNGHVSLRFDTYFPLQEKKWYHLVVVFSSDGNTGF